MKFIHVISSKLASCGIPILFLEKRACWVQTIITARLIGQGESGNATHSHFLF